MRRRDVLAGVLALAASPASARPPIPNHGTPRDLLSPPFVDGDGRNLTLADFEGRVVLLNIWATWCPPCLEEIPAFMRVRQATVARGVEFVGIAIDQADKVSQFAKKLGISYPVLLADAGGIALIRQLGNSSGGLPFTLILDRQGNIAARKLGAATQQEIEALLLPMLAIRSG